MAEPVKRFLAALPQALAMGCSTSGNIWQDQYIQEGLVAAVIHFEKTRLRLYSDQLTTQSDSFAIGEALACRLDHEKLQAVFVLSEGLNVNGSRLMVGFNSVIKGRIPITGGLAGDGDRFESTWVWCGDGPATDRVCALGLYGEDLSVAHASRGGWDVLGPEREVTRSSGSILYEMDGQPALALYKRYLGDRAKDLPASGMLFPLALLGGDADGESKVRTLLAIDEEQQSITFAGDVPQHSHVRLMRANFDRLIDGAEGAANKLDLSGYSNGDALCIAISCVGRRLVLGPRVDEEIEAVLEGLPAGVRQIGFYSYGELSPLASGLCDLHNQTMTLTLWWEN